MTGRHSPEWFNASFVVLPPKGEQDDDDVSIVRAERDARPLNFKNTDNKTVASAINYEGQRGFIRGRIFRPTLSSLTCAVVFLALMRQPASQLLCFGISQFISIRGFSN
jgi:hypothetical protein